MKIIKPTVYIASPYSKGDPAINTHFQCKVFDQLLTEGRVLPIVPLWSHFQHALFPRPYQDWIDYDQELLEIYDCCLRLNAELPDIGYKVHESAGADEEVAIFERMGKPVFYSINSMNKWLDTGDAQEYNPDLLLEDIHKSLLEEENEIINTYYKFGIKETE